MSGWSLEEELGWPEFYLEGMGDGAVEVRCSDCDWAKVFQAGLAYGTLAASLARHGMGHQR